MKKFFIASSAALAMLVGVASCNSASSSDENASEAFSKETNDSISLYFGRSFGGNLLNDYNRLDSARQAQYSKDEIVKGIQYIIGADTNDGFLSGIQIGMQIISQIKMMEEQGVKVDKAKIMDNFKNVFLGDSATTLDEDQAAFQQLRGRIQQIAEQRHQQELENAPEAIKGKKDGEAFIAKLKKQDSAVKSSSTGLAYKIDNPGEGEKVKDTDIVSVKYVGKLANGTVFDDSEKHGGAANFRPTQVVPGFGEGLKLLAKGGKATFYIPGNLGYGAQGAPQVGIGPNALLVFEVEIVDINPEKKAE
jgi:FKBP-type peptidyl-prolyl cis-trans isomerase